MEDNYNLLIRLFVGVLKHQVKRYLGNDVVSALLEAGSEHLGERFLQVLKEEKSSREQAKKIIAALKSGADELKEVGVDLQLDHAPSDSVKSVVRALEDLETDLFGRKLQLAVQDLVSGIESTDAETRRRISIQLYQVILMAVLTIPELQPRAQDLLQQSRTWLLSEQIRRVELRTEEVDQAVISRDLPKQLEQVERAVTSGSRLAHDKTKLRPGLLIASGEVELVAPLGIGGQGSVWLGRFVMTDQNVAVKFLHQDLNDQPWLVDLFKREVDALSSLSGNGVIRLIRPLAYERGLHFYIIEYIEYSSNFDSVIRNSDIPIGRKIKIITDVAETLHGIHDQGFVHGDVTPHNIIIDREEAVRLIDFGATRRIGSGDVGDPIMFTYGYAPPELYALINTQHELLDGTERPTTQAARMGLQWRAQATPGLDIYALGIMLFQVLDPGLGRVGRMEERALVDKLLVNSELKAVIRKAISSRASDRFQSALEFKRALESATIPR